MKLQVLVKNASKAVAANTTSLDATVGPADTVLNVQELIASMSNTFSFPDQKLLFKGKVLAGNKRLAECGIKDGDVVEFEFQASEQTLVNQLTELLGKKAMSPEELSLLYSYKFAVSFDDALKALGQANAKMQSFMESQKCFSFQGNHVKIVEANEKVVQPPAGLLCPIKEDKAHGLIEVNVSVEVRVAGRTPELLPQDDDEDDDVYMRLERSDTVARTKEIIAAYQQLPFPDCKLMLGETKLKDGLSLDEAGVKNGSVLVLVVLASAASLALQLEQILTERTALSAKELGLLYSQRFGTPVSQALRTLGLNANLGRFLEGHSSQFSIKGGCVTLTNGPKLSFPKTEQEKADAAMDALDHVMDLISEASFLSIDDIHRQHGVDGEALATIFVKGLPPPGSIRVLAGLQKAVASSLGDQPRIDSACIVGDTVMVKVEGGSQTVSIRLAAAAQ